MRPRVFVSSVVNGFEEVRAAARAGVEEGGGEPVLVEDFPALDISPRSACLDAVAASDIVMVVVGERGGWRAPSGKLVVEEEFDEAVRTGRRTIVFIQDAAHDADATLLVEKLSSYVEGRFRVMFSTPADLRAAASATLPELVRRVNLKHNDLAKMKEALNSPYVIQNETTLRLVLQPERQADLVDPVALEAASLRNAILEIGHAGEHPLLMYERAKRVHVGVNEMVVLQRDEDSREGRQEVRVELQTNGMLIVDTNVTGRAKHDYRNMMGDLRVVESDVEQLLNDGLRFAGALYDRLDPYKRFDQFGFNASLAGLGYRTLGPALLPSTGGISMGDHGAKPVIAFDTPRVVTRSELDAPHGVSGAALALIRRRLSKGRGTDSFG
jgi:hypothetical protein